uniref:Leucine-rich repeat-containing protein n=2 Tax=Caenorhabditis tropicalis TaxID=1561998 RepID=A0A1I7TIA5_9PELO
MAPPLAPRLTLWRQGSHFGVKAPNAMAPHLAPWLPLWRHGSPFGAKAPNFGAKAHTHSTILLSACTVMEDGCSTLVRSLEKKYLDDDDEIVQGIIFTGFTGCSPCKMASQRALELLVLNNMNIGTIGDSEKLAMLASHVSEADLGWNQISQWSDVACILKNLPHLRVLNIGHNPLNPVIDHELPVSTLHTIILNGTHLPFKTLQSFLSVLPKVTELHMSDNQFNDDDDCDKSISTSVRTIHLNRCGFLKWSSVMNVVKRFPNVCSVFVCENPLKDVTHCKQFDQLPFLEFPESSKNVH